MPQDLYHYLLETVRFKNRLGLALPEGFHYQGGEDYVLDRGSPFEPQPPTKKERAIVLAAIRECPAKQFRIGHCYYNAQILVASDQSGKLRYCEGYALGLTHFPVIHAWVVINRKVIDLTWRTTPPMQKGHYKDRIWGEWPESWGYYGALFDTEALLARMHRIKATGSFLDDVAHGFPLFQEPRLRPSMAVTNSR